MSAEPYNYHATGCALKKLRQKHGWTQAMLAEKVHRSVSTISALERGEHDMSIKTFLALCRALQCLPSELLGNQ